MAGLRQTSLREGLYTLFDHGLGLGDATDGYWTQFLEARRTFLEAILSRTDRAQPETESQLRLSVETALKWSVTRSEPGLLERYTLHWRRDLRDWQRRLSGVRKMPSVEAALEALALERSTGGEIAGLAPVTTAAASDGRDDDVCALQELYDIFSAQALRTRAVRPLSRGKPGGRNRPPSVRPHHGSPRRIRLAFASSGPFRRTWAFVSGVRPGGGTSRPTGTVYNQPRG